MNNINKFNESIKNNNLFRFIILFINIKLIKNNNNKNI